MSVTRAQLIGNVSGGASFTGIVTATSFSGNGSGLTGVGLGTTGSINTSGIITATSFSGNGSGLTGVGLGTTGSINTSGIITATSFSGNGSGLTGVAATTLTIGAGTTALPSISPTGDTNTGIFFPAADTVAISEGGTEALRVDSSGRLLIGTTTSTTATGNGFVGKTQIASSENAALALHGHSSSAIYGADIIFTRSRSATIGTNTIVQNGDQISRIYFTGANGTGFDYAASIGADVDGTPGASGDMPGRLVFSTTADGSATPTERARIDSSGRLLVGTSSALNPSTTSTGITFEPNGYSVISAAGNEPVTINRGNDGFIVSFRRNGVPVGSVSVTSSSTAFNTSSDYRLKENVTAVTDGITRLQQLKPSRFNFIADPDTVVDGFLAHEVQTIVPEAITGEKDEMDADGNPVHQGIDQSKLVPLLTAALQEAIAKIESLEARLTAAGID